MILATMTHNLSFFLDSFLPETVDMQAQAAPRRQQSCC